ncbi:MAG TPA: sigma-70 family RNA polymerase sigma factor [Pirellulales bacterium]|jgi:RNA polymerase sigma-70 factor (ECF subfamily)|nr:sigma-70 family RNA polymerase sigma factor [Pirellulales bacterium]
MNTITYEPNTYESNTTAELVDLVLAAQDGDRAAFGQLCVRFERMVYSIALVRLGNHAEAQELCQEVFIHALEKLNQLREPECFGGWLRSMAGRMAINRAMRRQPLITAEAETLEGSAVERHTPLDRALAGERQRQVRAALKRLKLMDRETLVAFYVKGHSLVEMSDRFDSPVGTIKRRLHVARKRLAKELSAIAP